MGYLRGDDPGATTARRMLPAILVLPLVMGFAQVAGERLGLESAVVTGLTALATMGSSVALVAWSARG